MSHDSLLRRKFSALVSYLAFSIVTTSQSNTTSSWQFLAGSLLSTQGKFANCLDIDFEAIQDMVIRSPDSEGLAIYEEHSRREVPRCFRRALEAVIVDEAQPVGERLSSRLVEMMPGTSVFSLQFPPWFRLIFIAYCR